MSELASTARAAEAPWVDEVLHYWFHCLGEVQWWGKDPNVDTEIQRRFGMLHERLLADDGAGIAGPRPRLAAVLALDQFARHLFRGSPRAFAADPLARRLARAAIAAGDDQALTHAQRLFLYLPFEHSEDRVDQAQAVALIDRLGNASWSAYARTHQAIIVRFGRFPHRHAVLGRSSTAEEAEVLAPLGSAF